MAAGARALGLDTVGDLLQHLPSDSRESRTLAELRAGEPATVEVRGALDLRAPGAPPGDAPAGRGARGRRQRVDCAPASSTSRGWSTATRPAPGCCCTASPTAAAASASPTTPSPTRAGSRAPVDASGGSGTVAHYPASEGLSSTQILTLVRGARAALADFPELLPSALRAAGGLPDKPAALGAAALRRRRRRARAGAPAAGLRGAAVHASCCSCAAGRGGASRTGADRAGRSAAADRALAGGGAAVHAHRATSGGRSRRSPATWRAARRCSGC